MTELRNAAIVAELERAIARRSYAELFGLLCRFSGLPGPHANESLAWAVARAIAAYGARADGLVNELCAVDRGQEYDTGTVEFLPIVGAYTWVARVESGTAVDLALQNLRKLAEDSRQLVRQGVVKAIAEMSRGTGDALPVALAAWMDEYLPASVALEAMTERRWLDGTKSAEPFVTRIDEAFALVEGASRSDQRSQGYRTLLKTLPQASAKLMDRFPGPTISWLESRATTDHVELREALGELAVRVRSKGHGPAQLERFGEILSQSAPPRRDPKTYVGPTRRRGAKRR
jgi:hypothetical protein